MTRTTALSSWLVQSTLRIRSRGYSTGLQRPIARQASSVRKAPYSLLREDCLQRPKNLCIYEKARTISSTAHQRHGHLDTPKPGEELHVSFIDQQGQKHDFEVAAGANLLDIAQAKDLEMEGACGGSCACSTCHVIVEDSDYYDKMQEPDDDENDMLDLAFGLTETSRLGCQVNMSKDLDGLVVRLPSMTRNLQKSDFEKK